MGERRAPDGGARVRQDEARACEVLDEQGSFLAAAVMRPADGGRALLLSRVAGKGRLLSYYFGRGGRRVFIETGEFRLRGRLRTRWLENERLWIVDLDEAAAGPERAVAG